MKPMNDTESMKRAALEIVAKMHVSERNREKFVRNLEIVESADGTLDFMGKKFTLMGLEVLVLGNYVKLTLAEDAMHVILHFRLTHMFKGGAEFTESYDLVMDGWTGDYTIRAHEEQVF